MLDLSTDLQWLCLLSHLEVGEHSFEEDSLGTSQAAFGSSADSSTTGSATAVSPKCL
eukprot:CAMPEP_0179197868 /NCGR_PEP_ID=MMETSP0796-20121207/98404_1 /TAXON_ID=73915 /ORGANISM="Pyrodinium bahamense, Strain pbaha01" /LENGTH=56 /DNA_ID=CAMNT_0020902297 /DNA_START=12 /DNA_END=179 /DNA_ORIENTATION=+